MIGRLNTFNGIAPFYDTIKRVVFGSEIYRSQIHFIGRLAGCDNLLMIGGGSGEILSLIQHLNPGCRIWYVEASSRMLSMAASRISTEGSDHITFIHGTETSLPAEIRFDAVITNFFLDLFPDDRLASISRMIYSRLQPGGIWLVSDFVDGSNWWQKLLLRSMYSFFAAACGIQARTLPALEKQVCSAGMLERDSKLFYGGFIKCTVYIKDVLKSAFYSGNNYLA
jgi:ubiquinone/menaquinone biosynthesis C-methylase UbiE